MKKIAWFASAAFALAGVLGTPSHAETTDKQIVRCVFEYSTGVPTPIQMEVALAG